MKGKVKKIDPVSCSNTRFPNKGGSTSTITDELKFAGGITAVHINYDVGQGEGAKKRYHRSVKGWDKILKGLKELVEGE